MSDIVERLKSGTFGQGCGTITECICATAEDAADEITRLRAEVEKLCKSRNRWGQKYNKLLGKHKTTRTELANQIQWVRDLADNLIAEEAKTAAFRAKVERLEGALVVWQNAYKTGRNEPLVQAYEHSTSLRAALGDTHER